VIKQGTEPQSEKKLVLMQRLRPPGTPGWGGAFQKGEDGEPRQKISFRLEDALAVRQFYAKGKLRGKKKIKESY